MIQFKDIHIPKPCSVDYDSLPGNEAKRFCGSCEKHVYDFRGKDEVYLNEVFQKTGKVCGVYYEDQIRSTSLKIERPFYYAFTTKIIGIGLFIKMLLSSYDAEAKISKTFHTIQVSEDSINVKTIYKGKDNGASLYDVNIDCYVNDTLIKSYNLSYHDTLQLAGNFLPDDKIKLIVSTTRLNITPHKRGEKPKASYYSTKTKVYNFRFKEIHTVTVKINYNKKIFLSHKKRNAITGLICPSNFW